MKYCFLLHCAHTGFDYLFGKEFLWVYIKDQLYPTVVASLQDLKECIFCDVEGIPPEMCIIAFWAFEYQVDMAWATKGAQIEVYKVKKLLRVSLVACIDFHMTFLKCHSFSDILYKRISKELLSDSKPHYFLSFFFFVTLICGCLYVSHTLIPTGSDLKWQIYRWTCRCSYTR
jgi:hypothetical protein